MCIRDRFNARQNAKNFDADALSEAVAYCHGRDAKVYLTLNTLVGDQELAAAMRTAFLACDLSIDGVIVQDLGLASLLHKKAPSLPLHGSTQMSVSSLDGLRTVSYTHLDVYKRQALPLYPDAGYLWSHYAGAGRRAAEGHDPQGCLLYTSRCV